VYHLFAVRTSRRDSLLELLAAEGVSCGIHYPVPIHLQEAYSTCGMSRGRFPVAERCAEEFLSLPMFPELTEAQIERTTEAIKQALQAIGMRIPAGHRRSDHAAAPPEAKGGSNRAPTPSPVRSSRTSGKALAGGGNAAVRRTESPRVGSGLEPDRGVAWPS
jgi:hypothetical protein